MTIHGGADNDIVSINSASADLRIYLDDGSDMISVGASVEKTTVDGGDDNDTILSDAGSVNSRTSARSFGGY